MGAQDVIDLLQQGKLTVYPLGALSVIVFAIFCERAIRYRGLERATRELTRRIVDALVRRDLSAARTLCETSKTPISEVFSEGLRWRNIALEDLNQVLGTSRQESSQELRRGVWFIGTVGSLAPYVGLLGTVIGIMRAFQAMALEGAGGFEVVAAGISEALVATAVGLLVAIIALAFFNFLQMRAGHIASSYARSTERFVQALLYVESGTDAGPEEVSDGQLHPA